jgi:predicted DNA-binding transcriptional regulator AlpA
MASTPHPSAVYLTSQQTHARYGRREPWAYRRCKTDPTFPKPIYIAGRKYWLLSELEAYEAAEARRIPPAMADDSACAMRRKPAAEHRGAA